MLPLLPLFAALLLAPVAAEPRPTEQTPGLGAQAKIPYEQARKAALAKVQGAKIVEAELEKEHGRLVYSFDLHTEGKEGIDEVQVDALTGAIVSVEHEDKAAEAAEKARDAPKAQGHKKPKAQ